MTCPRPSPSKGTHISLPPPPGSHRPHPAGSQTLLPTHPHSSGGQEAERPPLFPKFIVALLKMAPTSRVVPRSLYIGRPCGRMAASRRRSTKKVNGPSCDGMCGGGCGTQWGRKEVQGLWQSSRVKILGCCSSHNFRQRSLSHFIQCLYNFEWLLNEWCKSRITCKQIQKYKCKLGRKRKNNLKKDIEETI